MRVPEPTPHAFVALQEATVVTPGGDCQLGAPGKAPEPEIVARTDRIRHSSQFTRIPGAPRKEIRNEEASVAPRRSESDASPNCGIIVVRICA